jgi:hypothetical protein
LTGDYLGFYRHERRGAAPDQTPAMLGVELLGMQERNPFT